MGPVAVRRRYRSRLREQQTEQTRRRGRAGGARSVRRRTGGPPRGCARSRPPPGWPSRRCTRTSRRSGACCVRWRTQRSSAMTSRCRSRNVPSSSRWASGRRPARVQAAARLLTTVQLRTATVAKLLRQAAPADDEIAEMLQATRERQRQRRRRGPRAHPEPPADGGGARRRLGDREPRGLPPAGRGVRLDARAVRGMGRSNARARHPTLLTEEGIHGHGNRSGETRSRRVACSWRIVSRSRWRPTSARCGKSSVT